MIKKVLTITAVIGAGVTLLSKLPRFFTGKYTELEKTAAERLTRLERQEHDLDCPSLYSAYIGCNCDE